ncbi:MAG: hypothetical protein Q8P57_01405 [Candidatus Pacearchaeota archaeon]|nr:hypothetical protein [Candidatus Pacearchaeota archaeon]
MNKLEQIIKHELQYHAVSSLAQLSLATPIFALYETTVANMTVEQSLSTRYWATAITFAGVGYLDEKVRNYVRKKLDITDQTEEKRQKKIDRRTKMVFNTVRAGVTYLLGLKGRDPTKLLRGVGLGVIYGRLFGARSGYMMDLYKDLSGLTPSRRIPERIRNLKSRTKKLLMAGLIAASIGTTAGIYKIIPPAKEYIMDKCEQVMDEQVIENR